MVKCLEKFSRQTMTLQQPAMLHSFSPISLTKGKLGKHEYGNTDR